MILKKLCAYAMAAVFILNSGAGIFSVPVNAADAQIKLTSDRAGGSQVAATILRGSKLDLYASNVQNAVAKDNEDELYIVKTGEDALEKNPYFDVELRNNSVAGPTLRPLTNWEIAAKGGLDNSKVAQGNYRVTTNYQIHASQAERASGVLGTSAEGAMVCKDTAVPLLIGTQSQFVLTIKPNVTDPTIAPLEGDFTFTLSTTDSAITGEPGRFKDWKERVTFNRTPGTSAAKKETYELNLLDEKGDQWTFVFTPNATYRKDVYELVGGVWQPAKNPDGSQKQEISYNLDPKVTEYKYLIQYAYGRSKPEFNLDVLDPRTRLQKLANDAVNVNLSANPTPGDTNVNQYVKLTNKEDTKDYITANLKLENVELNCAGERANLRWEWVGPLDSGADAIRLVGYNKYQEAVVTRQREDVKGELLVTAEFNDPNIQKDVRWDPIRGPDGRSEVVARLPITVHGTGVPPTLTQKSQMVGSTTETFTDTAIPSKPKEMDLYRNTVEGYEKTANPYVYTLEIDTGNENGLMKQLIIDAKGDTTAVSTTVTVNSQTSDYTFGALRAVNVGNHSKIQVAFTAAHKSTADLELTFRFFVAGPIGGLREEKEAERIVRLRVNDSSPDPNAILAQLKVITDQGKPLEGFTFDPGTTSYVDPFIPVPYAVKSITLEPISQEPARSIMGYNVEVWNSTDAKWQTEGTESIWTKPGAAWVDNWADKDDPTKQLPSLDCSPDILSILRGVGDKKSKLTLPAGQRVRVTVKVRAQDPNIVQAYQFVFRRDVPSTDATLKEIKIIDEDSIDHMTGFDPEIMKYSIDVPYHVTKVNPQFTTNSPVAKAILTNAPQGLFANLLRGADWVDLAPEEGTPTSIRIRVDSESDLANASDVVDSGTTDKGTYTRIYEVNVTRLPPGHTTTLSELKVWGTDDKELTYTPVFHSDMEQGDYYELFVPYSAEKVRFSAKATDPYATVVLKNSKLDPAGMPIPANSKTKAVEVKAGTESDTADYFDIFEVEVTDEATDHTQIYPVHICRAPPSRDGTLKSLAITDQDAKPVKNYEFDPEIYKYTLDVPYETEKVAFTPTASYAGVKRITVNGRTVKSGATSALIKLGYPDKTTVDVVVTPEDPDAPLITYSVTFKRSAPSSEARLFKLVTGNTTDFKPVFAPSKTNYSATMTTGAEGVTVTPTAVHAAAKITVDGNIVASGATSEIIRILSVHQTITVVVTAQDGKTTMTYKVNIYNPNLENPSSNADLEDLEVQYGAMRPEKFSPAVTDYAVSVEEECYSVTLIPIPADPAATLEVKNGTKKIGDFEDNYAAAIQDGENEFTITVTSPDKKVTKDYTVIVYRNDEDNMGILKPITPEDIDIENSPNPILVDITKYSRISREVFEELKKYPEKTIIFQGNDYSLRFDAKDLQAVIPHTDIFDLGLSFTSPLEDEIYDEIDSYSANDDLDIVMVYFKYHGALPGPATLTMSLGTEYANMRLYWHYYNEERKRIDYYGNFLTNSRGTFSIEMDHMSTWIIADERIAGSENKFNADLDLGASAEKNKLNPNTGEGRMTP